MTAPTAEEADTLAELYDLLAGVFGDPPEAETVRTLAEGPLPDPDLAPNEHLAAGLDGLAAWGETVDDPGAEADRLGAEFTRLFVGPRPKLQIHESYYAGDFLGEPLAAVRQAYRTLGIEPAPDLTEEADHVAVELAALRELSTDRADRRTFLAAHGDWFEELAADVRDATEEPFYEAIADLLEGLIAFDASRVGADT